MTPDARCLKTRPYDSVPINNATNVKSVKLSMTESHLNRFAKSNFEISHSRSRRLDVT